MAEKRNAHEMVAMLKETALELGRTPSKAEFLRLSSIGQHDIYAAFGSFTGLVQAAGLVSRDNRKITNAIFERSIESHLEAYRETGKSGEAKKSPYPRIAVISDIHWPFHNQRVVDAFIAFIEQYGADYVILNGDAWDMYSHSKFPRSHNVFTPRDEQKLSREENEKFWKRIQDAAPKAKCYQLTGNHDARPLRHILETYPEAEDWVTQKLQEAFTFPGVETFHDPRQELILGDVMIHHGYRSKLGDHRDYSRYNAIVGHTHKGGCVFRAVRGELIWELNSGLAGDPLSKGLSYTPQRITDWTAGFGYVWPWGPQFIPA